MRAHKIKIWPPQFAAVKREDKTCEVRRADRDYQVGDYLMLIEFDPKKDELTGAYECRQITHIVRAEDPPRGLVEGFVVLSMIACTRIDQEHLTGGYQGLVPQKVEWLKPLT